MITFGKYGYTCILHHQVFTLENKYQKIAKANPYCIVASIQDIKMNNIFSVSSYLYEDMQIFKVNMDSNKC